MSDWNMYELENISWEEFGRSDDHTVPQCGGEHAHESAGHDDSCKKQHQEVETAASRANDEPMTFQKADIFSDDRCLVDGRTLLVGPSWSHECTDAFPLTSDSHHINVVSALASQGNGTSDSNFANHQTEKNDNVSCINLSIGNVGVGVSDISKMSQSSVDDVSPEDKEPRFPQHVKNRESNVLMDCEWDEINNLDNVDKMFRNCGTALAQGSIESADELSWFLSSSHMIDGCEDAFNLGIQSSYPEFGALTKSLKLSEANMGFLPENDSLTETHLCSSLGYSATINWLDANLEVSETMGGNETKLSAVTQNSNRSRTSVFKVPDMGSGQMKLPKGQCNTMEKGKSGLSETKNDFHVHDSDIMQSFERKNDFSIASSSLKTCPLPLMCHQNLFPRVDSNHSYPYDYHVKTENGHVTHPSSVKKSGACVESELRSNISPPSEVSVDITNHDQQSMESSINALSRPPAMGADDTDKISHKKQSHVSLDIEKTYENFMCEVSSSNQVMLQHKSFSSQHESEGDTELADMSIECPKFEMDYLAVQEDSTITVFSDDISLGSASFRKLQDVFDQLDIRTKLCIRDGLYRLARNAEIRHCIDSIKHNRTGCNDSSRTPRGEKSKQASDTSSTLSIMPCHMNLITNHDSSTMPSNA